MKAKSIFNGKMPALSHIDGLLHFVDCVIKAMATDENIDYVATLKSKLEAQAKCSDVQGSAITALRIFKVLSPVSASQYPAANNKNQLVWNCFLYDRNLNLYVGCLQWFAPEHSRALIIICFTKKQANMYYYTGHVCNIFGKHTERFGGSEELGLPRDNDIDLTDVPVDRFPQYIESDLR